MTSDNTVSGEMLAVEQRHRDAAMALLNHAFRNNDLVEVSGDEFDDIAQAFARFERDHMPAHSTPSVDGEMLEALKGWDQLHADMISAGGDLAELPPSLIERFAAVQADLMGKTRAAIARAESAAS